MEDKKKIIDSYKSIPVLTTRGDYVFPGFEKTMEIGRDASLVALDISRKKFNNKIVLTSQNNAKLDNPEIKQIFKIGVLATLTVRKAWEDGSLTVVFKALERVKLNDLKFTTISEKKCLTANADILKSLPVSDKIFNETLAKYAENSNIKNKLPNDFLSSIQNNSKIFQGEVTDFLAQNLEDLPINIKQSVLAELNVQERLKIILDNFKIDQDNSEIEKKLNAKIKSNVDDHQREYYLREKLKAIKEELGELEGADPSEMQLYTERLNNEPFPQVIKDRVLKEISRFEGIPQISAESNIIRTYIDWMMSLPWHQTSKEIHSLQHAIKVLDAHHYGLQKVKKRILEYLAVRIFNQKAAKGQIICLVGPPGVGKTSLAKSIAEATGRVFVKVSLGGVKDEAEVRGHRKTYIGAMPGRILQTMKKAKVKNPLFLLDEIDKMSSSYNGDPSSAMLEVLDPEQNAAFSDHYIEEEFNLQDVMFIATANYYQNIPEALIDRMEIIQLSSYTELEKYEIAVRHLIPAILQKMGLTKKQLNFTKSGINEIIKFYTREAGVRELERLLTSVARKFIVKKLNKKMDTLKVAPEVVNDFLGKRIFDHTKKEKKSQIGVVTGLAYTQYGGDILPIEVNYFPGKGNLVLTGKLGDIMKESATIALDYIKANMAKFKIKKELFETNDIHIHVPEGAVPKDGPSAGITITTAIISALSKRPVSKEIGMTGEITLRGHVLPIGGLKEKSISSHRSQLKQIIIPAKNKKDLEDIPEEVRNSLKITFVEKYTDVYKIIFGDNN